MLIYPKQGVRLIRGQSTEAIGVRIHRFLRNGDERLKIKRLHCPIMHGGNRQRPKLAILLWDVDPSKRLGPVALPFQHVLDFSSGPAGFGDPLALGLSPAFGENDAVGSDLSGAGEVVDPLVGRGMGRGLAGEAEILSTRHWALLGMAFGAGFGIRKVSMSQECLKTRDVSSDF